MTTNNINLIENLIAALCENNKEQILPFFHEDAIYHNIPLDPAQGHDAIWAALEPIHSMAEAIDWVVHHWAESSPSPATDSDINIVMTERTDRYKVKGQWAEFKVMGIFEIKDGKVAGWRDYFDLQQVMGQLSG